MAHRRLALDRDVLLVVVHLEQGLGRVVDLPHHHRRDLDGVARQVVHLQAVAVEVAGLHGDLALGEEGVGVAQADLAAGALVVARQQQDRGLVGVDDEESRQQEDAQHQAGHRQPAASASVWWAMAQIRPNTEPIIRARMTKSMPQPDMVVIRFSVCMDSLPGSDIPPAAARGLGGRSRCRYDITLIPYTSRSTAIRAATGRESGTGGVRGGRRRPRSRAGRPREPPAPRPGSRRSRRGPRGPSRCPHTRGRRGPGRRAPPAARCWPRARRRG